MRKYATCSLVPRVSSLLRQEVRNTFDSAVTKLADEVRHAAQAITGSDDDYDYLLQMGGDARYVLLGEASHGTHEFYFERARITRRLIAEKGFTAVAVEADWPDAYRINRFVRGASDDGEAVDALGDFER